VNLWVPILILVAGTLVLGAGCQSASGREAAFAPSVGAAPPRDANVAALDAADGNDDRAQKGTKGDAGAAKAKKRGDETTDRSRGSRGKKPPPVPSPRPRYRCSETYCDDRGNCFGPSPPNCIP
jgi:hypothetical protein